MSTSEGTQLTREGCLQATRETLLAIASLLTRCTSQRFRNPIHVASTKLRFSCAGVAQMHRINYGLPRRSPSEPSSALTVGDLGSAGLDVIRISHKAGACRQARRSQRCRDRTAANQGIAVFLDHNQNTMASSEAW
jgi:hypothetical protein